MKKLIFSVLALAALFTSCKTLQEDIYYSSSEIDFAYQAIEEYENRYVELDSDKLTKNNVTPAQINPLILKIDNEAKGSHQEPAVKARLASIEGLLYLMEGKKTNAQECYKIAKSAQPSDQYCQILGIKLEKDSETQLQKLEDLLQIEENNGLANLEKAKILYSENKTSEAVVAIDKALLQFTNPFYVEKYTELKELIWASYENQDIPNITNKTLTPSRAVEITATNSQLLTFYTAGKKMKTSELIKNLEKHGYFSDAFDSDNQEKSSRIFLNASELNRQMTSRFLWNLYVSNIGNPDYKTQYSKVFTGMESPIPDVSTENKDFDAVIGCVENGFMDLSDGVHFQPFDLVTEIEFANYLGKIKK